MNFFIREATPEELPRVVEITNESFNSPFITHEPKRIYTEPIGALSELVQEKNGRVHVLVAVAEKQIVGAVRYELCEDKSVWLWKLAVLPTYRRKGIAPALIKSVEDSVRSLGYRRIKLEAMQEKGLPGYYEKFGFKIDSILEGAGRHDAQMSKEL